MQIIDELVEYFAELLTKKQSNAVAQLFGIPKRPDRDSPDGSYMPDGDDEDDEYGRYDEYEFPAKTRHGHSGGKRRRWRHPVITAEGLAAAFRETARATRKERPFSWNFIPCAPFRRSVPRYTPRSAPRWRQCPFHTAFRSPCACI